MKQEPSQVPHDAARQDLSLQGGEEVKRSIPLDRSLRL